MKLTIKQARDMAQALDDAHTQMSRGSGVPFYVSEYSGMIDALRCIGVHVNYIDYTRSVPRRVHYVEGMSATAIKSRKEVTK